mmetsp:Transcript_32761/g.55232  ORF Transcript_32761/g.55232 Transcript_32761/m.55232 type:complete len:348 (+) Transcript_32761:19-1062(+)|eukprot:CAMPEP_0174981876 /NCGR_PEP_ID=MMETSP0004_2-20121128/16148_1 /TAXON_ID=420556 /ORGANISM="Ochromonas sp., Strain CCMP1393" /LENGTH=347 /DNA_ID=CAMNT_0016233699 /DNA_START=13 /DNA_END=1056 /DNA_ORIENTATION=-
MSENHPLILQHFSQQIFLAVGYPDKRTTILKKKWRVGATAVAYFRRFYTVRSLLDHDPRLLMLCCLFLAGKIEDSFVNLQDVRKIYNKYSESDILACEIILLEELQFDLKVFHPQNCVYTLIADIKRILTHHASTTASSNTSSDPTKDPPSELSNTTAESKHEMAMSINHWLERAEVAIMSLQSMGATLDLSVPVQVDGSATSLHTLTPLSVAVSALRLTAGVGPDATAAGTGAGDGTYSSAAVAAAALEALDTSLNQHLSTKATSDQWSRDAMATTTQKLQLLLAEASAPLDLDSLTALMRDMKRHQRWKRDSKGGGGTKPPPPSQQQQLAGMAAVASTGISSTIQ